VETILNEYIYSICDSFIAVPISVTVATAFSAYFSLLCRPYDILLKPQWQRFVVGRQGVGEIA